MGNSESSNPVRNMDKRTARREYKDDFAAGIARYRQQHGIVVGGKKGKNEEAVETFDESSWGKGDIRVFVRKRPIFPHELENSEFDVISCVKDKVIVHDARMHNDMKRQLINHHEFQFDYVFNERSTNEAVYQVSTKPLVQIACDGGFSTALMYGQTGSGKTFTMSSIYTKAATEIFTYLHNHIDRFQKPPTVSVSFIEIAGETIGDLLNGFQPTQLRSSNDGLSVHAYPITEPTVRSTEELIAIIQHGLNIRTTAATGVHDASSRSHAILRIYIHRHDLVNTVIEGTLTLVDLAGSEHRIDSMYHGKERRKETSYINASLMALKECIRARSLGLTAQYPHVYRKSKLTMALKTSFQLPSARTIVIATVSPASKDTEHSINTLRHACIMYGQAENSSSSAGSGATAEYVTGGQVTTENIGEINISNLAKRNMLYKKEHGGIAQDLKTGNGNAIDSKASRAANQEVELTDKMKRKIRRQCESKSFAALSDEVKDLLRSARKAMTDQRHPAVQRILGGGFATVNDGIQSNASGADLLGIDANGVIPIDEMLDENDDEEEDDNEDDEKQSIEEDPVIQQVLQKHRQPVKQQNATKPSKATIETAIPEDDYYAIDEQEFHPVSPAKPQQQPTVSSSSSSSTNKKAIISSPVKHLRRSSSDATNNPTNNTNHSIPFQSIYEALFIAKDSIPLSILLMQLRAMLAVHQYSVQEIEYYIQQAKGMNANPSTVTTQQQSPPSSMQSQSRSVKATTAATTTVSGRSNTPTNRTRATVATTSSSSAAAATPTPGPHILNVQGTLTACNNSNTNSNSNTVRSKNVKNFYSKYDLDNNNSTPIASTTTAAITEITHSPPIVAHRRMTTNSKSTLQLEVLPPADEDNNSINTDNNYGNSNAANNSNSNNNQKVMDARAQLDQEANLRKERLEKAKQFREEMQLKKRNNVKVVHATNANPYAAIGSGNSANNITGGEYNCEEQDDANKGRLIAQYEAQIEQLKAQLVDEKPSSGGGSKAEEGLSLATKFGIKKQIAMIKATILKLQRKPATAATVSSSSSTAASSNVKNMHNPFDDTPLPAAAASSSSSVGGYRQSQSQPSQSQSQQSGYLEESYGSVSSADRGSNGDAGRRQSDPHERSPHVNRYQSNDNYHHGNADNNEGDCYLVSDYGRPLSKQTAQQVTQRQKVQQQHQQQYQVSSVTTTTRRNSSSSKPDNSARPPWQPLYEEAEVPDEATSQQYNNGLQQAATGMTPRGTYSSDPWENQNNRNTVIGSRASSRQRSSSSSRR